jgi:dTDP-4-dehydrorhamnose reductase
LEADGNPSGHGVRGQGSVVVVGAAGQLGQAMLARLNKQWKTLGLTRDELDLTDPIRVRSRFRELAPDVIVNCAGYNQVDEAEKQPVLAMEINAFAVLSLARAAADAGAALVQFSSDFVFDGHTDRPYSEDDPPAPQSVYAASKLIGEWFSSEAPAHYILRVESLFGGVRRRKSSLDKIIDAVTAGNPVRVFVDRVVSPSYVWDVADATAAVLESRPTPGIYHCVNTGAASWLEVAEEARRQLGSTSPLEPITAAAVVLPARRPRYCALSNEKLRRVGIDMPTWQDALSRALRTMTDETTRDK